MGEKRLSNSELRLGRLEQQDPPRDEEHGIFELFDVPEAQADEDEPLQRDTGK